ncbi:MAG: ATP-binding cassette domain-containing protein [Bacteroidetes bacterium]|nr:ATP-binding cassette domain-containing protein [Bacteroidota bacterium]
MSIEAKEISKNYGSFPAVKPASFSINTGEIVGFLGPNGAGKTTTMKMLTGILKPTSGTAGINGFDILEHPDRIRREIGFLPENNPLYTELTVSEYLDYAARIGGIPKDRVQSRIDEMTQLCGLETVTRKQIGTLSKGFRQRVGLAQALIHDPAVLILDEPTTGLDPNQIIEIRDLILNLGREKTVLLSTHILQEVEAICSRVLIINEGELVADGTPAELQTRFKGGVAWYLEFAHDLTAFQEKILKIHPEMTMEVISVGESSNLVKFTTLHQDEFNRKLYHFCRDHQIELLQMYKEESNLEDIFRRLTLTSEPRNTSN